jgi:hypothetical protein
MNLREPEQQNIIPQNSLYHFQHDQDNVRIYVKWTTKQHGVICNLDLFALSFDERVSLLV